MARVTSQEAYNQIKSTGLLSSRRWEIYDILWRHGPLTASEIEIRIQSPKSPSRGSNVHARLGELAERGVVYEVGQSTHCSVSGMSVILWDVTAGLPADIEKKQTKSERIHELETALKVAVHVLVESGSQPALVAHLQDLLS